MYWTEMLCGGWYGFCIQKALFLGVFGILLRDVAELGNLLFDLLGGLLPDVPSVPSHCLKSISKFLILSGKSRTCRTP